MNNSHKITKILILAGIIIGLYFITNTNYLLFHSIVEVFSILIATSVFIIALNTKKYHENNFILIIGTALLYVGMLDLIHTFAYPGMNILSKANINVAAQLWIMARFLQSTALILAVILFNRKINFTLLNISYALSLIYFMCHYISP